MDSHSDTPIGPPIVAPASRGASRMLLVVLPLVTLALGVAIGGWVIRPRNATGGSENSPPAAEPYTQRGTVKPEHLPTGVVYYQTPFASPPHLELKPSARFLILKQDEAGFTWADRARVKDVTELANQFPELAKAAPGADKPEGPPPNLEWEATGPRAAQPGSRGRSNRRGGSNRGRARRAWSTFRSRTRVRPTLSSPACRRSWSPNARAWDFTGARPLRSNPRPPRPWTGLPAAFGPR